MRAQVPEIRERAFAARTGELGRVGSTQGAAMKRWSWLMAMALSVSMLGFAGCEDDDDDDEGTTTTTTGDTTTGGTTTGGTTTGDTTPADPDNANVAGDWNGPQNYPGGTAHFNVSLTQDAADVVRGTFSAPDISAPVGFLGLLTQISFVFTSTSDRSSARSGRYPFSCRRCMSRTSAPIASGMEYIC